VKLYIKRKIKAQSSLEFAFGFVTSLLFLYLSCNLFVWLNHNIVQRQRAYEQTRTSATRTASPGKANFYCGAGCDVRQPVMNLFVSGGYR